MTALHEDINLDDETNLNGNNPLLYARHGQILIKKYVVRRILPPFFVVVVVQ